LSLEKDGARRITAKFTLAGIGKRSPWIGRPGRPLLLLRTSAISTQKVAKSAAKSREKRDFFPDTTDSEQVIGGS
jgi:hypothetical protein